MSSTYKGDDLYMFVITNTFLVVLEVLGLRTLLDRRLKYVKRDDFYAVRCSLLTITSNKETFLRDFLVIIRKLLIIKKCFLGNTCIAKFLIFSTIQLHSSM